MERVCSRPECNAPHRARGLCRAHYRGDALERRRLAGDVCAIDGCTNGRSTSQGLCSTHDILRATPPRTCEVCQTAYVPTYSKQRTCSRQCGAELRRHKPAVRPCRYCGDGCLAKTKRQRKWRDKRRRRALKLGAQSESYTLAEIALRDRNVCGLCHKRVAMKQVVPHPKAPTIDHVVPMADGGDDTRANVQLAHFLCNSLKCTRGTQQLMLIG